VRTIEIYEEDVLVLVVKKKVYNHNYTSKGRDKLLEVYVVVSANGILFLAAWEIMTLSSFFLVTMENEKPEVRRAGFIYLIAAHIGTAFLFVMFWILAGYTEGTMDFSKFMELPLTQEIASILFVMAVIGFGTKAGLIPFHVWLPEAHPAAPSHVSAIMSGVMIKTGIYGILRISTFLGMPPLWWGILLVAIGLVSGLMGVLLALAQHNIKRFLAYCSVENIGIITLGLGIGFIGITCQNPTITALGLAGALLHVLNHGIFKSLLFLGTGAVVQETNTKQMDSLGGLLKKMPITGTTFLIGSVAICGLPPLNGFLSEFFIYLASFYHIFFAKDQAVLGSIFGVALVSLIGLVLMGGLALAAFTKSFSGVFLGEPRTQATQNAHDPDWSMLSAMIVLAGCCLLVPFGVLFYGPQVFASILAILVPSGMNVVTDIAYACDLIAQILPVFGVFIGIFFALMLLRWMMLKNRPVTQAVTWDCGYLAPTPRIQYTTSSFAQPITDLLGELLHYHKKLEPPTGYFSAKASFVSHAIDIFMEIGYRNLFQYLLKTFRKLDWLQHGRLHLYLLYIAGTLVGLFIWFIEFVR